MPTRPLTIKGITVQFDPLYEEGHVLNANEAATLNQTLGENLRNNFADTAEDMVAEGKSLSEIQSAFTAYAAIYKFGERKGGFRVGDPILRLALNKAKEKVRERLRATGQLKTTPSEQIQALAQKVVDTNPKFMEWAKDQHEKDKAFGVDL